MNAVIICPAERPEVSALSESVPLVNLSIFGKPFLFHWLEHLANCGAKEIKILAADRPEQVREIVGDGARWGLRVEIIPESNELTRDEAREKYCKSDSVLDAESHLALIDHFPGFAGEKLFESYTGFFSALQFWLSQNSVQPRIGVKEIKPGVWVGMRTQVSPRAKLIAPCWIGENVLIKEDAVIGPMAILENGVVVENNATIYESWVGSETFAGSLIQVKDSLALGNLLVNLRLYSIIRISDSFLLCALGDRKYSVRSVTWLGRLAALLALALTSPFALATILKSKWQGQRLFRARRAATAQSHPAHSIIYFEFANANGWWKRWPQLWNVARGEFSWIGNRPLTPIEAGKLANEFERLWLAAPIGIISQGDAEGCSDVVSDESRAHASFYAAQASWRLDGVIFFRACKRLLRQNFYGIRQNEISEIKQRAFDVSRLFFR